MDPLSLLGLAVGAAALAAVASGPIYSLSGSRVRPVLGWSNAFAAGLMLGAAFALALEGWGGGPGLPFGIGAALGLIPGIASYRIQGHPDLWDGEERAGPDPSRAGKTHEPGSHGSINPYASLVRHSLHAAPEGVAIGVAASMDLGLGLFLAGALAVHNIAEGISLVSATRRSGGSVGLGAVRSVASNLPQVAFALVAFALLSSFPGLIGVGVGFSVASLVYLALVDLLPQSYEQAGEESIAVVTAIAMSTVPFLAGALGL
jgi:ZIP family zinc transporter